MKKIALSLAVLAVVGFMAVKVQARPHTMSHCADCHQPHRNFDANDTAGNDYYGVPLFNSKWLTGDPVVTYEKYASQTFDALNLTYDGQPNGSAKLCLGCHDGTYTGHTMTHVFTATTLKLSHPISVDYVEARTKGAYLKDPVTSPNLVQPGKTVGNSMLDQRNRVQCVSCHDIHTQGGTNLLRGGATWDGVGLNLCKSCHDK